MKVHFTLSPTELAHVKEVYDCQTEDSLMMKRQNVCPRNKTGVSSRLPPAANNQTFFSHLYFVLIFFVLMQIIFREEKNIISFMKIY